MEQAAIVDLVSILVDIGEIESMIIKNHIRVFLLVLKESYDS